MKNLLILFTLLLTLPASVSAQGFLDKVLKGVEKTNKILDETDKMLGNDNSSGIEVQVTRSIAAGKTVIIDFILTNHAQDAYIDLGDRNSIAYDDLGMTYQNPVMFYNLPITRKDNSVALPPSESETSANQTSTGTLEIDEDFDTFEEKFVATSRFQMLHIKVENLGYNGEGEKWYLVKAFERF